MSDNNCFSKCFVESLSIEDSRNFQLALKQTYQVANAHAKETTKSVHIACTVLVDGRPTRTCTSDVRNHAEINAMSFPGLWSQTSQDYESTVVGEASQWEKVCRSKQWVL